MENNWRKKSIEIAKNNGCYFGKNEEDNQDIINAILEGMKLVFETTKQKCFEEVEIDIIEDENFERLPMINENSILNIQKPNL